MQVLACLSRLPCSTDDRCHRCQQVESTPSDQTQGYRRARAGGGRAPPCGKYQPGGGSCQGSAARGDGEAGNQQNSGHRDKVAHDPYTGPWRRCSSNMRSRGETTACKGDNVRARGSDDRQGSAAGQRSGQSGASCWCRVTGGTAGGGVAEEALS